MKKAKRGNNKLSIALFTVLGLLTLLIATRGVAANLNQRNLSLNKEVAELVSTNQWIKYQISDKISLDKIEAYAKDNLGMVEVANTDIKYLPVEMDEMNMLVEAAQEDSWVVKIQKNVGDIFNGQGR